MDKGRYDDLHGDESYVEETRSEEECQIDELEKDGYEIRGRIGKLLFVTTPYGKKTVKLLEAY